MKAYEVFKRLKLRTRIKLIVLTILLTCAMATPIILAMNSPYEGWWSTMLIATTYLAMIHISNMIDKYLTPLIIKWLEQDERS